ncbi:hypothetical protein LWI28_019445 [Acer negundo]|uniref:Uncharacterized protein n=1 Tax=Acer negundo TaxID=4023 RepID=A0AAD5P5I8_ACENE|nr:hypothetical protein LWI28_019445 [Acer negundo]
MMRVAVWCLQNDYNRMPSMSTVVKVLEGTMEFEAALIATTTEAEEQFGDTTSSLQPSILSGPSELLYQLIMIHGLIFQAFIERFESLTPQIMMTPWKNLLRLFIIFLYSANLLTSQYDDDHDYPSAQLSTSWTNNNFSAINITKPSDSSQLIMRIILLNLPSGSGIGLFWDFSPISHMGPPFLPLHPSE